MSNFSVGDWVVIIRSDAVDSVVGLKQGMFGEVVDLPVKGLVAVDLKKFPDYPTVYWFGEDQLIIIPKEIVSLGVDAIKLHVALAHSIVI